MTAKIIKKIVFCLLLMGSSGAHAQIARAEVGVNGLTCSQCSRSVEMELRKLPFVRDVRMDLQQTTATLTFSGRVPDLDAIGKAVRNAGFSMRYLDIQLADSLLQTAKDGCLRMGDMVFSLQPAEVPASTHRFQVIGKGLLPDRKLKDLSLPDVPDCHGKHNYFLLAK